MDSCRDLVPAFGADGDRNLAKQYVGEGRIARPNRHVFSESERGPQVLIRILHVGTARSWRGGEQQLAYLLKGIPPGDISQEVFCPTDSALAEYCRKQGLNCTTARHRGPLDLSFARKLAGKCRSGNISLLHCHDSHALSAAVLAATVFSSSTPVIASRRVDFPIGKNRLSRFKYNYRRVLKVICVSEEIQRIIAPAIRRQDRLITIHSGIDVDRFASPAAGTLRREHNIAAGAPLIGNIAALAPHKDYFTFIDTACRVHEQIPEARFVLIGEGALRKQLEEYVLAKGMKDICCFCGFRRDIPAILPELDVFLTSSRTEGLGTSILDAFASRVPVVATAAGGIPEVVRHEVNGLLAPPGDAAKLAMLVLRVLQDSELRSRLVESAFASLARFRYQATAERTASVYRECIA